MKTRSMNRAATQVILAALVSTSMASTSAAQDQPLATAQPTFDLAIQAYERGHYEHAYATLAQLAEQGHDEALRMSRDMWRFGPSLFGQSFRASERQQAMWMMRRADATTTRAEPALR